MSNGVKRLRDGGRAVITANRLRDGAVVWRGAGGAWHLHFDDAAVLPAAAAPDALAAARLDEARCLVIGAYVAQVDEATGRPEPAGWKERIRARGPSVVDVGALHGQS